MNPATVTPETLAAYREFGVNRASFGVQTFNDRALKLLARGHDANDARMTFLVRQATKPFGRNDVSQRTRIHSSLGDKPPPVANAPVARH